MTLGGLALAVGILVDDATVEIENIHRNLAMGKPLVRAILDGAQQIAVPLSSPRSPSASSSCPCCCSPAPRDYLFTPLAMAVVFAMVASYLLSRTLVPTMVHFLLAMKRRCMQGRRARRRRNGPHLESALRLQSPVRGGAQDLLTDFWIGRWTTA